MELTRSERLDCYLVSYGANQAKKVAPPKAVKKAAAPKPRKSAGAASSVELELLEAAERDVVEAREAASEYKAAWQQAEVGLKTMQTENRQLFAELETLKSGKSGSIQDPAPHSQEQSEETNANETEAARRSPLLKRTMEAGEAVMANVGTLKLYEILLGLVFISVILSWNPYV